MVIEVLQSWLLHNGAKPMKHHLISGTKGREIPRAKGLAPLPERAETAGDEPPAGSRRLRSVREGASG